MGWSEDAFEAPYTAFDPALLTKNDALFRELIFAAHVMLDEEDSPAGFVEAAAAPLALDEPCRVCRTIDVYRRERSLAPPWLADYAALCAKALACPPCATAVFVAAFEFVYVMDKHFRGRASLQRAFATRVLTLVDVQRHFFLHGCFRTVGDKIRFSNQSFLVQAATRAMFFTVADARAPPSLGGWKDHTGDEACAGCCAAAEREDDAYERAAVAAAAGGGAEDADVGGPGYADLAMLLLGNVATGEPNAQTDAAEERRHRAVDEYWAEHEGFLARNTAAAYARYRAVDATLGPVLALALKHVRGRNRTHGECLLCNMLLTRAHWLALRRFRRRVLSYSENNAGLFDCIEPVLEGFAADARFLALMRAAGPRAVYKHLFCDPLCAVAERQADPRVLFERGDALRKAQIAAENRFEGRVCGELWTLAYVFKAYQLFPPKPTARAAFLRDAHALLRRHGLALVSLEHTLGSYV
ncbi:UL32 protein [Suid alphaherpesvirus 1]|nr:UL32 protein [Suid alphaherpesvirus 1]